LPEAETDWLPDTTEYSAMKFACLQASSQHVTVASVAPCCSCGWDGRCRAADTASGCQSAGSCSRFAFIFIYICARTLPRFRYDSYGVRWKVLLPLAIANI